MKFLKTHYAKEVIIFHQCFFHKFNLFCIHVELDEVDVVINFSVIVNEMPALEICNVVWAYFPVGRYILEGHFVQELKVFEYSEAKLSIH